MVHQEIQFQLLVGEEELSANIVTKTSRLHILEIFFVLFQSERIN